MGNFDLAKKMVLAAKKAGADAVKFQTYIPEEMVFKNSVHYNSIKNTNLSLVQYKELKKLSKKLKLDFFSTAFDYQSYLMLLKMNVDCLKIASMDLNNFYMFDYLKKFKKPIILSTGMSNFKEINKSYNYLKKNNKDIFLLHCISNYPTENKNAKIGFMQMLKKLSSWRIGFSDHSLGNQASAIAAALGAKIIEKHFTIDNKLKGADNRDSFNTTKMIEFVGAIRETEKIVENFSNEKIRPDNFQKKKFRRYFFARKSLEKNEKITKDKLICLRSDKNNLLPVDSYHDILNKKTNRPIKELNPIKLNYLK